MFPASIFFAHVSQDDIALLLNHTEERAYLADESVILEGKPPGRVFLLLSGLLSVYIEGLGGERTELTRLGPGELIGDVSWLDNCPASASVRTLENSLALSIDTRRLDDLLAAEPRLAAPMLRAVAALNAARVRRLTQQLRSARGGSDRLSPPITGPVMERLAAFKGLLLRAEREATSRHGSAALAAADVPAAFQLLLSEFSSAMSGLERKGKTTLLEELGAVLQRELLPYLLLTGAAARFFSKPRGYAGDCETIALVYANTPTGTGGIGPILDACFLERPGPKAVRNRRGLVAEEILASVERTAGKAHVTSLACGPAAEAFDAFHKLPDKARLRFTALDIDHKALDTVARRADAVGVAAHVACHQANLVYLSTGRQRLDLAPQDLVYSIGLIDYFNDQFVIKLLDWIYDRLAQGGRTLLGNFHPRHPDRHFMDHILEWKLIHRDEQNMNGLFAASKFARPCTRILFEDEGVNLFAECSKA